MPPEVITALTAAFVSLIGSILTLAVSLRILKLEREKLQTDRERLMIEAERLQSEIAKLGAETEKLRSEVDDAPRQRREIERTSFEIEKQKALALLETRKDVYPEMLELVYRLRNGLRRCLQEFDDTERLLDSWTSPRLGQELYLLTENLYKYRAFIDGDTFDMLHRYKRILQDAQVLFNVISRRLDETQSDDKLDATSEWEEEQKVIRARYEESSQQLAGMYNEIDELYYRITQSVQSHIATVLQRR